jgi:hypothetical protein
VTGVRCIYMLVIKDKRTARAIRRSIQNRGGGGWYSVRFSIQEQFHSSSQSVQENVKISSPKLPTDSCLKNYTGLIIHLVLYNLNFGK